MYVFTVESNIEGYIIIDTDGHIASIAVNKKYRRMGIGTKLINKSTRKPLTLNVHVENKDAIKFYKKNGFREKDRLVNYYDGALEGSNDAIKMVRN